MRNKIGILIENRFIEKEIYYYQARFAEEGYEVVLLTRLWGQNQLTFKGLELQGEVTAKDSFEFLTDEQLKEFAAIIVPAGYVADYLLYSEKPCEISPAAAFIARVMKEKKIVKGFICHSLWLAGPIKESFAGRVATCHNNIISHVKNVGVHYVDRDIRKDEDMITARTGGDYAAFARMIIDTLKGKEGK